MTSAGDVATPALAGRDGGFALRDDPLNEIWTLAEAATVLGVAPVTLRAQAARGRLKARLIGKTWVTTRSAIEQYRLESLGKPGRPRTDEDAQPRRHFKWSEIKRRKGAPEGGLGDGDRA
jgi:hypothetical protein